MRKLFLTLSIICLYVFNSLAQDANITIQKVQNQDSTTIFVQTKPNDKSLFLKVKEGADIAIYIDGKKYDSDILDILDQSKIATAAILNGEFAMKKYNEPNVILIITKKEKEKMSQQRKEDKSGMEEALIFIDGKEVTKEEFNLFLKSDDQKGIVNINVLKDEKTLKKYNTKVGVILITTKNKK